MLVVCVVIGVGYKNSSVDIYYKRNSNKIQPALAKYAYRDKCFIFVHVWNYVYDNIVNDVSFLSLSR